MTDTNTAQLVVDLQATDEAVRANGWVAPGLGMPGAPLSMLSSTLNPLTGLATAGLAWFTPLVSFLGDGLAQLQGGNPASVSSGSQDFGGAGQDIAGVADSYRTSTTAQTSGWTGTSADEYRQSAAQHADGVAGLGEASNTTASAIMGAGQVVAQAIAEITQLIAEAVAEIVPIMTQAVARAAETFGQSVVEAIPPCVGIAVTYAAKIAAKIAALIASGDNLMKLVQGAMAIVDLIKAGMTSISQQSTQEAAPQAAASAGAGGGAGGPETPDVKPASAMGEQGTSSAGSSGGSGSPGGGVPNVGGLSNAIGASTPSLDGGTRSAAVLPPAPAPNLSSGASGHVGGSGAAVSGGGVPMGAAGLAQGAHTGAGRGADTARQEGKQQQSARAAASGGSGTPGGMPMGAMGGGRPGGDGDKEHQRKYRLAADHEEDDLEYAPEVIDSGKPAR